MTDQPPTTDKVDRVIQRAEAAIIHAKGRGMFLEFESESLYLADDDGDGWPIVDLADFYALIAYTRAVPALLTAERETGKLEGIEACADQHFVLAARYRAIEDEVAASRHEAYARSHRALATADQAVVECPWCSVTLETSLPYPFDPSALPLSVAMMMARARTEAGEETWVYVVDADGRKPLVMRLSVERLFGGAKLGRAHVGDVRI